VNSIIDNLKLKLTGAEKRNLAKRYTENVEAYNLYNMGRFFWNKRTEEDNRKAITFFEKAIKIDPDYALAYTGLSDSYGVAAGYHIIPSEEAYLKAINAANKALELDDTLSEAYTSLASLKRGMDWDWKGSEEAFLRAIRLNTNNANAHHWYGFVLSHLGRHDEAIKEAKRAQELDPLSHTMSRGLGGTYLNARQYKLAIEELERAIELGSTTYFGHLWLFYAYHQTELYDEAIEVLLKYADLQGFSDQMGLIEKIYRDSGYEAALRQIIPMIPGSFHTASFYSLLGDEEKVFEWLEKAYHEGDYGLGSLKVDPNFDRIRSDARYKTLLKKINLE
jgi:tetratricopeptide (TPR) repeat protein